jgi:phosphoribosyl-ATP pyrophosphohydrolase/phosphoribosyl-AMP cyclohydrolase/histidinol dehydrogenase
MMTLRSRLQNAPEGSYTKRLFTDPELLAAKLREEAQELADASTKEETIWEAADVFFFALVACAKAGVRLEEIEAHLDARALKVKRRAGNAKPQFMKKKTAGEASKTADSKVDSPPTKTEPAPANKTKADDPAPSVGVVTLARLDPREVKAFDRDPVEPKAREIAEGILGQVSTARPAYHTVTHTRRRKHTSAYGSPGRSTRRRSHS